MLRTWVYDLGDKELKSLEQMEQLLYAKLLRLTFGPWMISRCWPFTLRLKITIKTIWVSVFWKIKPDLVSRVWSFGNIYPVPKRSQTAMSFLPVAPSCPGYRRMSHPGMVQSLSSATGFPTGYWWSPKKTVEDDQEGPQDLGIWSTSCVLFCPASCREWWRKK